MEKLASRNTAPSSEEVKVYIKAKNAPSGFVKEIKPTPTAVSAEKKEARKKREHKLLATPAVQRNTVTHPLFNLASKYNLKKLMEKKLSKARGVNWGTPRNPFIRRKESKLGKVLVPFALSICGAVLVGVVMGLSILSLFFSNHTNQSGLSIDSHLSKSKNGGAVSQASLPPLHVVMLQGGIFNEKERAQKAVEEFKAQGLRAVLSAVSPFRIFLGLATSDVEASKLAAFYKKEKVDVYQKKMSFGDSINLKVNPQKIKSLVEKGNYLITHLSKQSSQALVSGSPLALTAENSQYYQQFYREAEALLPSLPSEGKRQLATMKISLSQAVKNVSGKEGPSQVQEELVRYVTAYEELIRILSDN